MKKITSLLLIVITLFSSCESEFNVNSDWQEVMVVYGLLDQSQDKQYIRINRAFLGQEDAYVMASVADSINYNPNNLEVKLEKLSNNGMVLSTKILTDTIMIKEEGIFSVDDNIIYFFNTDNFLNDEKEYKLTITNLISGKVVTSQAKLVHDLILMSSFNNPAYKIGFYNSTGNFSNTTIEWSHSKNASIYQITLFINYTEYGTDTIEKTVQKVYPIIEYDGEQNMSQQIIGEEFFNILAYNVSSNSNVNRRINNLDILFSAGTSDLNTYINLNEPPTGIVQERDLFTNIYGGIGLFTSRINKTQENILFTNTTKEAIATYLDSLNFIYP